MLKVCLRKSWAGVGRGIRRRPSNTRGRSDSKLRGNCQRGPLREAISLVEDRSEILEGEAVVA